MDEEVWWQESKLLPFGQDAAALLWSLGGSRFRHHEVSAANLVVP
jgi:hypothetical protein